MRYDHVIWDWNGTLLDDAWLCMEITNGLLSRRGRPLMSPERYQALFDFPVRCYYERLGFDMTAEPFEQLGSEFIREYERRRFECELQPSAEKALTHLAEAGVGQSVLSAYDQASLVEVVEHYRLAGFFTDLVGIDNHYASSKLGHGLAWLATQNLPPDRMLLIGDTVHDHEVAQAMGIDSVLLPRGHHGYEKLSRCGVPVYRELGDVIRMMEEDHE